MKTKNIVTVLLITTILVSCAPVVTVVSPTETTIPTLTFTPVPPTETTIPTLTFTPVPPTATSTPIPPIESLPETQKSVTEFANAMQNAGVNITPEQILQQGLTIEEITGVDGKKYEIASTQDGYPLMIKGEKEDEWSEVTPGKLGELKGVIVSGMVEKYPNTEKIYNSLGGGEIGGMWGFRQKTVGGSFDWSYEDFQLNYAGQFPFSKDAKHMLLNSIIWPVTVPEGFDKLTRDQAIQAMEDYITQVMTRYKDKIGSYVVVNEPRVNDLLVTVIGKDYIEIAFKKARVVNPNAILIYNQTDNHDPNGKFVDDTEKTGNKLWSMGLIDAIGVQGHLAYGSSTNYPSEEDMYRTLTKYKAPIILTELDVNLSKISDSQKNTIGAEWYKNLIKACLRTERCKAINIYGAFPDKNSWYVRVEGQPNADSTLWSNDSKPKKAYYELMKALIETP